MDSIARAARRLLDGGLVAFPTETVYGLGADAQNPAAVAAIYAAKGRPSNHPVIVHLAPEGDVGYWADPVPDEARALMRAFWPGPLTLILKRAASIPDAVSGGQDSIGLRCPSHPVAQQLLRAFAALKPGGQGGVAAPSANKFGQVSPTRADHVRDEFPSEVARGALLVLDGGASAVGIESTILDLSRLDTAGPVLLRPGHVTAAQIGAVLGRPVRAPDAAAPRASGTLKAHYAPHTRLELADDARLLRVLADGAAANAVGDAVGDAVSDAQGARLSGVQARTAAKTAVVIYAAPPGMPAQAPSDIEVRLVEADPARYAHELYALLRELDQGGYDLLLVQRPPAAPEWAAVNDRIGRAAAAFALDVMGAVSSLDDKQVGGERSEPQHGDAVKTRPVD